MMRGVCHAPGRCEGRRASPGHEGAASTCFLGVSLVFLSEEDVKGSHLVVMTAKTSVSRAWSTASVQHPNRLSLMDSSKS